MKSVIDKAWVIPMGLVNGVLLEGDDGELVLIDAGFPGKEQAVFDALSKLGRPPTDLKHLVFTHAHPDHIGSAAEIVRRSGARTWMHPIDVPIAEGGGPFRTLRPAKEFPQRIIYRFIWKPDETVSPVHIDEHISDGDVLPLAGGLEVIHTPGHSLGHVALRWKGGRLLMAGDVCTNNLKVAGPIGYEDLGILRESQRKLAELRFDAATFGHGRAIDHDADRRLRKAFGA